MEENETLDNVALNTEPEEEKVEAPDENSEPSVTVTRAEHHKKKEKKPKFDKEKEELRVANLDLKEKVLRITAEMQNMRRRYDIDKENLHKYDGYDLVEKILPILDNFERALKIKSEGNEKFLDGFKMIYDNLVSILNNKGIVELEALNKAFDPNVMNAVTTEVNNDVEENTVLEVLQKGYMYNERLVRPAMVKVSEKNSNES